MDINRGSLLNNQIIAFSDLVSKTDGAPTPKMGEVFAAYKKVMDTVKLQPPLTEEQTKSILDSIGKIEGIKEARSTSLVSRVVRQIFGDSYEHIQDDLKMKGGPPGLSNLKELATIALGISKGGVAFLKSPSDRTPEIKSQALLMTIEGKSDPEKGKLLEEIYKEKVFTHAEWPKFAASFLEKNPECLSLLPADSENAKVFIEVLPSLLSGVNGDSVATSKLLGDIKTKLSEKWPEFASKFLEKHPEYLTLLLNDQGIKGICITALPFLVANKGMESIEITKILTQLKDKIAPTDRKMPEWHSFCQKLQTEYPDFKHELLELDFPIPKEFKIKAEELLNMYNGTGGPQAVQKNVNSMNLQELQGVLQGLYANRSKESVQGLINAIGASFVESMKTDNPTPEKLIVFSGFILKSIKAGDGFSETAQLELNKIKAGLEEIVDDINEDDAVKMKCVVVLNAIGAEEKKNIKENPPLDQLTHSKENPIINQPTEAQVRVQSMPVEEKVITIEEGIGELLKLDSHISNTNFSTDCYKIFQPFIDRGTAVEFLDQLLTQRDQTSNSALELSYKVITQNPLKVEEAVKSSGLGVLSHITIDGSFTGSVDLEDLVKTAPYKEGESLEGINKYIESMDLSDQEKKTIKQTYSQIRYDKTPIAQILKGGTASMEKTGEGGISLSCQFSELKKDITMKSDQIDQVIKDPIARSIIDKIPPKIGVSISSKANESHIKIPGGLSVKEISLPDILEKVGAAKLGEGKRIEAFKGEIEAIKKTGGKVSYEELQALINNHGLEKFFTCKKTGEVPMASLDKALTGCASIKKKIEGNLSIFPKILQVMGDYKKYQFNVKEDVTLKQVSVANQPDNVRSFTLIGDVSLKDKDGKDFIGIKGLEFTGGKLTAVHVNSDWLSLKGVLSVVSSGKSENYRIPLEGLPPTQL